MVNFKNILLFTGAGFTANYGGFLAREMWAKIYNNPKLNGAEAIKQAMRDEFDYEKLYSQIIVNRREYPEEQIKIFEEVLDETHVSLYKTIDKVDVHEIAPIKELLDFFKREEENKIGACFTLNHDVFLERHFQWEPYGPVNINYFDPRNSNNTNIDLNFKNIPENDEEIKEFENDNLEKFAYIKLHGSLRWRSKSQNSDTIITGINKYDAIQKIPLLKWYLDLFNQAIQRTNVKLIIIEYGFGDEHINHCLKTAIIEHGLKLYIVSPEEPKDFRLRISYKNPDGMIKEQNNDGIAIWKGVAGYFPYKLKDMFGTYQSTVLRSEFYKAVGIQI